MPNHLVDASSPYLQQHAHQPVDWWPWNETALRRAREEDKPILLSVGFATCHWCHVMARESFDDPDIAAFMNAHFVCIKLDREERPDLDQFYMAAGQIISRNSGWPLNIFLTPERKPFYAGTYFPPEPSGRQQSWLQALQYARYNFRQNRSGVEQQAERVLATLQNRERTFAPSLPEQDSGPSLNADVLTGILEKIMAEADQQHGGFGQAPKYPDFPLLRYLLHHYLYTGEKGSRQHLLHTVDAICRGGMYDQLEGGIARYSVDEHWRVPHFEKMLVDNVQWLELLALLQRTFPDSTSPERLIETLDFIDSSFQLKGGGYGSALDAETDGVEGKFYTWTYSEFEQVLGPRTAEAARYFGVLPAGNWEGTNILYRPADTVAPDGLDAIKRDLRAARNQRTQPSLDNKILTGVNAYLISAWLQAAPVLPQRNLVSQAKALWNYLHEKLVHADNQLAHSQQNGQLQPHGFLSDYALWIQATIDLFETTGEARYLHLAETWAERALLLFGSAEGIFLDYSPPTLQETPLPQKDLNDLELPSGNSVMHRNLWRLGLHLNRRAWMDRSWQMLVQIQQEVADHPTAYGDWAHHLHTAHEGYLEVALLGPDAFEWAGELRSRHVLPQAILLPALQALPGHPLTEARPFDQTRIYLCRDYACQRPLTDLSAFAAALDESSEP